MSETVLSFDTRAARAMRSAYEDQKDGALICETKDTKRLVFFEGGHIVGAKSNLPEERLGEVMVRTGRLERSQLEEAVRYIRSGRKLGSILVELGYLRGGEIEEFVRTQIVEIAGNVLVSEPVRLIFSEQVSIEAVTLSPVSIGDVFLEAVKRLPGIDAYRENVLHDDYVFAQTNDALALAAGMKLSDAEAYVLDLVDGRRSVGDVLSGSPLLEEETVRLLVGLHQSGILGLTEIRSDSTAEASEEPRPGPRATPVSASVDPFEKELVSIYNDVQCQNHWQVLGLERGASYSEIDRAYRERAARFDPQKYQHLPSADFQEKLSFVRARLTEAFQTLSSQTSSNVYEGLLSKEAQYEEKQEQWEVIQSSSRESERRERLPDAEESARLFKRAKRAYREGDFWSAITLCRTSIELDPEGDAERFHLLGEALMENPRWRQDAEKNLKIAQNLKPWEPRYLVSLGRLYEKEGMHQRAKRLFDQVKAMDPDFEIETEDSKRARGAHRAEQAG